VWVDAQTRQVLSVNDPDFVGPNTAHEIDLAYMKRGRAIQVGQVLDPSDIEDVFEIKTSYAGEIGVEQLEAYRRNMNGRTVIKVHVPKRQRSASGRWVVEDNPRAIRKIGTLGRFAGAAGAGLSIFSTAMTLAGPATSEDQAYEEVVIATNRYLDAQRHSDAQAKIALLDLVDAMRRWLTAAVGDPTVANIATEIFARGIVDRLWR
jgi:hypothetical protein